MIRADLIVEGAAEVVTCAPGASLQGAELRPTEGGGSHHAAPAPTVDPAPAAGPAPVGGADLLRSREREKLPTLVIRAGQNEVGAIRGGAVACAAGRIVFVGTGEACAREVVLEPGGIRLDASGGVVLPGFVDPHTHLPFGGWRERDFEKRIAGLGYREIAAGGGGIASTVRATRALAAGPPGGLEALVRERLDAMLVWGTTTVEAKSGYGLSLDAEIALLRALREGAAGHPVEVVPTFLGAHVVPPEFRDGRRDEYVRLIVETMLPAVAAEGLARFCDVFVDEGAFTPGEAERILRAARGLGLGLRVHAEQLTRTGAAALAASFGAASVDHLEHLSPADIDALAASWNRSGPPSRGSGAPSPGSGAPSPVSGAPEDRVRGKSRDGGASGDPRPRGTVAVLLPGASYFLGERVHPPARALIERGVPVALATDFNPGTSPCLAMPPILNLASILFGMSPDEAIVAATRTAALSLGLEAAVGTLEVGRQADLAVWGIPDRRHLAYRFGPLPCRAVVKRGKLVARNGARLGT